MTTITVHDPEYRCGCHVSKLPSLTSTFESVVDTPLRSFQFFIDNPRGFKFSRYEGNIDDIVNARRVGKFNELYYCIHGSLLYNLCGARDLNRDPEYKRKLNNVITGLKTELDLGVGLDCGIVCHIGTCSNKEKGIRAIADNIVTCLRSDSHITAYMCRNMDIGSTEYKRSRRLILENAAGEKNKIGSDLTDIDLILSLIPDRYRSQISVCIDTAHIFGAGQYDFGKISDIDKFYSSHPDIINRLELFHFNDSKVTFGHGADRHQNLGFGYIFDMDNEDRLNALQYFTEEARRRKIPLVGEPPGDFRSDYELLSTLVPMDRVYEMGRSKSDK